MVLFLRPRCRGLLIGSNGFVCFQSENGQMTEQSVTCESAVSKLLRYARVAGNNAALHHGFLRLSRNYGAASARSTILTGPLWTLSGLAAPQRADHRPELLPLLSQMTAGSPKRSLPRCALKA